MNKILGMTRVCAKFILKLLKTEQKGLRSEITQGNLEMVSDDENDEPAHSSKLVQQFLAKDKIVQLRQPPYSPDIAPCDFWMFPKLKMALKGKRFDDTIRVRGLL